MNEKLKQFAELKARIKILEDEADLLKPEVLMAMEENKLDQAEVEGIGAISLATLKKWTYTDEISGLEKRLKEEKKKEEQLGLATFVESHYIKFSVLKEIDADA